MYFDGEGVYKNWNKARPYFQKAIDSEESSGSQYRAEGGWIIGQFYQYGEGGLRRSWTKAKEYYEKACKLGHEESCKKVK